MTLDPSNSSNLEQLALKGLKPFEDSNTAYTATQNSHRMTAVVSLAFRTDKLWTWLFKMLLLAFTRCTDGS